MGEEKTPLAHDGDNSNNGDTKGFFFFFFFGHKRIALPPPRTPTLPHRRSKWGTLPWEPRPAAT